VTEEERITIADAIDAAVRRAIADAQLPRTAVSPAEAAAMLGVSRSHFDEAILPNISYRRSRSRILIPVRELDRWLHDGLERSTSQRDAFAAKLAGTRRSS
jgi:hypothetical protein